ncbi:amino acid permease-domain-containing protein [Lipomyces japonicus]|uniref:amino acid permease-domain-containing protein n=1 Tax=Lipomyces japonicus TaxID=56871 RepID=UPI0034CE1DB7
MALPPFWQRIRASFSPFRSARHVNDQPTEKEQTVPKMGTFSGVFIPTTLNVLSILMFLRFGFILGQVGVIAMIGILVISYVIDLLTVLSISAISTNGTVRGGGAYYMISRSLGPEFGGSIGIVFYIGQVLNTGLNVVGFVEPILSNFGNEYGITSRFLPEGRWFEFLYATALLLLCTGACLLGSTAFTKVGYVLFVVLGLSTLSVPLSTLFVKEHYVTEFDTLYSGLSLATLKNNTLPMFTAGAAGSEISGRENFQDIFGIFFPATAGIFAGASMSGDLKTPGKSIPKGTLYGLLMTFSFYAIVIVSMAASIPRQLLYTDIQVLQTVNLSKYVIILGEMSTALFSSIVGILGAAKVLQAIARDDILPQLGFFKYGTKKAHEPIFAIIVTYLLCQITLFFPINTIASLVTQAFLITFIVTNIACFLLKIGSAPNFRPSFHFFNSVTALAGSLAGIATMFFVDGIYATIIIAIMVGLFIIIHYVTPPKSWGDVSQSLIYHQVRKYLLRLRQDHVKFWRPQILLFVNDPRESWNLIHFCNSLKKGALYILGHVVVVDNFQDSLVEMNKIQSMWLKLRDISKVKAFVQMAAVPDIVWGARNVVLQAGLGGMKPNIAILGSFNLERHRQNFSENNQVTHPGNETAKPLLHNSFTHKSNLESLPTDSVTVDHNMSVTQYVNVIEDLLAMQINVAIARGFDRLQLPYSWIPASSREKKYVDLWPIQMAAQISEPNGDGGVLSTNFDTYTLILQLGAILRTVPAWKKFYQTRVVVFVEYKEDVEEERGRVQTLLDNLRIEAELCVYCLSDGTVATYETIIHGADDVTGKVAEILGGEQWWSELQEVRSVIENAGLVERGKPISISLLNGDGTTESRSMASPGSTAIGNNAATTKSDLPELKRFLRKRRQTLTQAQKIGMSFTMQTSHVVDTDVEYATNSFEDDDDDEDYVQDQSDPNEAGYSTEDTGVGSGSSVSKEVLSPVNTSQSKSSSSTLFQSSSKDDQTGSVIDVERNANTRVPATNTAYSHSASTPLKPKIARNFSLANSITSATRSRRAMPNFSSQTMPHSEVLDVEDEDHKTIRFASHSQSATAINMPVLTSGHNNPLVSSLTGNSHLNRTLSNFTEPYRDERYLSFNDLPARAQHLILNDLMTSISDDTAVMLATLPAPMANTYQSEEDSIAYLEELELWCRDLPPVLLVHSKSVTVTMAL